MKHAEELEADELAEQLVDEEFREAAGVLEMISKSPEDRQLYEARMKLVHDEEARLIAARTEGREKGREKGPEEGREEGRAEGSLAGKIQLLQQLLGEVESSLEDLLQRDQKELTALLLQLQGRLRSRGV